MTDSYRNTSLAEHDVAPATAHTRGASELLRATSNRDWDDLAASMGWATEVLRTIPTPHVKPIPRTGRGPCPLCRRNCPRTPSRPGKTDRNAKSIAPRANCLPVTSGNVALVDTTIASVQPATTTSSRSWRNPAPPLESSSDSSRVRY